MSGPSHAASFELNSNGSFSYTPAYHYVGVDSFTYKASDGIADSNTVTVSINVYNNAPVGSNDYYSTKHDVALTVTAPGVMGNDYDCDYDPIAASVVSGPSHAGSFQFNSNGSFTYTPAYHYVGNDTFTYKVNDGIVDGNTATVSINVYNNAPVFDPYVEQLVSMEDLPANEPITTLGGLVGQLRATDPDGDTVNYSMDANSYFAINAVTGVITVANPADWDAAILSGNDIVIPVHATDGIATVHDQFVVLQHHFLGTTFGCLASQVFRCESVARLLRAR